MVSDKIKGIIYKEENPYASKAREIRPEIGEYRFATGRPDNDGILYILRVGSLDDDAPVEVRGTVFDIVNGYCKKTQSGDFFGLQVLGNVSDEQLKDIKEYFKKEIDEF